jgi:hypothetical protein
MTSKNKYQSGLAIYRKEKGRLNIKILIGFQQYLILSRRI